MSKRFAFAAMLILVMSLLIGGTVLADGGAVRYDDTSAKSNIEGGGPSLICNGDFNPDEWGDSYSNLATCWQGYDTGGDGWVTHYANVNMADVGDTAMEFGRNDALGMFVRNVGGDGPQYMYATNELTDVSHAGDYWFQIHGTMWSEYFFWLYDADAALVTEGTIANSVAWYAISDEADATMVDESEWRELFVTDFFGAKEPGVVPCPNGVENCEQVGRYERVHAGPGQYLHLRAGMKFNPFNVWTVFEIDDIAISLLEKDAEDLSGHHQNHYRYDGAKWTHGDGFFDGNVKWDEGAAR
jgi:hypothetical protein